MNSPTEIYAVVLDAKYFPEYESFVLVVEDVNTKVSARPLQVSKTAMLRVAGIDPSHPEINDELMHYYAKMLKRRGKDKPIKIQSSDVDELTPAIENAIKMSNKADESLMGQRLDDFVKENKRGLFIDGFND